MFNTSYVYCLFNSGNAQTHGHIIPESIFICVLMMNYHVSFLVIVAFET